MPADFWEAAKQGDLARMRRCLDEDASLRDARDPSGATALHYAALHGHLEIVRLLFERGANINVPDGRYGATPAGWAIEYLREMGGYLGIELSDLAYAIRHEDTAWVRRFLERFPALREGRDLEGKPFRTLAEECGNPEIAGLFGFEP